MTKYIVRDIERAVCLRFKITPERLRGRECQRKIARPRQIAMALARELTGASLPQIGRHFGRDHTTVLHACRKIKSMVEEGGRMDQYLEEVRAILLGLTPVKQEIAQSVIADAQLAEPHALTKTQTQSPPRCEAPGGGDTRSTQAACGRSVRRERGS